MAYIMAPKEESEINIIKKACQGTMDLFSKFLKEQIMDIVDKDKVSHKFLNIYQCYEYESRPVYMLRQIV